MEFYFNKNWSTDNNVDPPGQYQTSARCSFPEQLLSAVGSWLESEICFKEAT